MELKYIFMSIKSTCCVFLSQMDGNGHAARTGCCCLGQVRETYLVTVSVLGVGRLHLDGVVHLEGREIAFGGRRPQQKSRTRLHVGLRQCLQFTEDLYYVFDLCCRIVEQEVASDGSTSYQTTTVCVLCNDDDK